jgi:hypothetical protein
VNPSLTFALRVWRVDVDRATSQLCRSWPDAARAVLDIYRAGLGPVVELVPCVEAMGFAVPLVSAAGMPWHSSERLTTRGRVEGDCVFCEAPRATP